MRPFNVEGWGGTMAKKTGFITVRMKLILLLGLWFLLAALIGQAEAQSITLRFPLGDGRPELPYTWGINSVLDHSLPPPYWRFRCNTSDGGPDRVVMAYTGEFGKDRSEGPDWLQCGTYAYKNPADGNFFVTDRYNSTSYLLYYDQHAGYDYACTDLEAVRAAAPGTFVFVLGSENMAANTVKVIHEDASGNGNGWETFYIHTKKGSNPSDGTKVVTGQKIGECWKENATGVHLHFEVHRIGKNVDPYGWEWFTSDPIEPPITSDFTDSEKQQVKAGFQGAPLWGIPKPEVTDVLFSQGSTQATIVGRNLPNPLGVTLWDTSSRIRKHTVLGATVNSSGTLAQVDLSIPGDNPRNYALKVVAVNEGKAIGPRSNAFVLSKNPPLALIGQDALDANGNRMGAFASFASFYQMTNLGDLFFGAEVDTNGDGLGDVSAHFRSSLGKIRQLSIPGISTAGRVHMNRFGDMAVISGTTQAIYFLKSGKQIPTKIAGEGEAVPTSSGVKISGVTYSDLKGPLALSDRGEVLFVSGLYEASRNFVHCCFLFLYKNADGTVIQVVGSGDGPTPVGGTFEIPNPGPAQISMDGDVVFWARVVGGSTSDGVFLFSRGNGYQKVVARGDPAPVEVGGPTAKLNGFGIGSIGSLSGRRLVFTSFISGGSAEQAIMVVNVKSPTTISVIASEGQPTGTEVGGLFSQQGNPSSGNSPFTRYDFPKIRADGGVVFHSLLHGATALGGAPTDSGIFLWTGKEFKKVVVDGDRTPSGGILRGASSFVINDIGQVSYFVARID